MVTTTKFLSQGLLAAAALTHQQQSKRANEIFDMHSCMYSAIEDFHHLEDIWQHRTSSICSSLTLGIAMGICGSTIKDGLDVAHNLLEKSVDSQVVRDLPNKLFFPLSMLLLASMLALFLLIIITGYTAQMKQHYLAPAEDADASLCDDVVISHSGDFLLSSDGYWEGDNSFTYSAATYVLSIKNAQYSTSTFQTYMDFFQTSTEYLSTNIAPYFDLSVNLVFWMSYVIKEPNSETNRFYMNAQPAVVFDRDATAGALTNQYYDCKSEGFASYDRANNLLTVSFDIDSYTNSSCASIVDPTYLGYLSLVSPTNFRLSLDVRSLITAVAVNRQILQVSDLQMIDNSQFSTSISNETYAFAKFVDPRYSGMRGIYCSTNSSFSYCFVTFGFKLAVPFFLHRGSNIYHPEACDCSGDAAAEVNNANSNCNTFNFLSGALFYDTTDIEPIFTLLNRYNMHTLHQYAHGPMFAGSANTLYDPSYFTNQTRRDNWYEFCDVDGYGSCNFVVFSSFDNGISPNQQVSASGNEVTNGSCGNSFGITDAAWTRAKQTPFSPLTEEYEVCSNDKLQAVIDNLGIASGDVSLVMPIGIVVIVALLYLVQYVTGKRYMKRHSESARSEILDQLATAILNEKLLVDASEDTKEAEAVRRLRSRKPQLSKLIQELLQEMEEIEAHPQIVYPAEKDSSGTNALSLRKTDGAVPPAVVGDVEVAVFPVTGSEAVSSFLEDSPSDSDDNDALESPKPADIPARSTAPDGKPVLVLNQSAAAVREIKHKFDQSVAAIEDTIPAMLDYLDGIFLTLMQVHSLHSPKDDDAAGATTTADAAEKKKAKLARKAQRPYLDDPLYVNVLEMLAQLQSGPWAVVGDKALRRRCSAAQVAVLKPLWMKLVAVLMVHSAILLQCDMSVVMQKHGDRVQYQLGQDFWTLNELQDAAC